VLLQTLWREDRSSVKVCQNNVVVFLFHVNDICRSTDREDLDAVRSDRSRRRYQVTAGRTRARKGRRTTKAHLLLWIVYAMESNVVVYELTEVRVEEDMHTI